jgi:hypothetical protein
VRQGVKPAQFSKSQLVCRRTVIIFALKRSMTFTILLVIFLLGYLFGSVAGVPLLRDAVRWMTTPSQHRPEWSDR